MTTHTNLVDFLESCSDFPSQHNRQSDDRVVRRAKQIARVCQVRRPLHKLDPRIAALDPDSRNFPLLRYGFAFPEAKLEEVAQKDKTELAPAEPGSPFITGIVERYLWSKCGGLIPTPFEVVWPLLTTGECMISLYTTKDLRRVGKLKRYRVQQALNILRAELGLGDQPAFWYWDFACGPLYKCPIADYNVVNTKA